MGTAEADLCAKIQDTIDNHLATHEGGGFVTGWYFVAEYIDTRCIALCNPIPDQPSRS